MLLRNIVHIAITFVAALIPCSARPPLSIVGIVKPFREYLQNLVSEKEISGAEPVDKSSRADPVTFWPDGDYCIMPGRFLKCPEGFRMDSISLAVPVTFGPREYYREGEVVKTYVRLGRFGGFNLDLREYDQAYVLRLNACCKI